MPTATIWNRGFWAACELLVSSFAGAAEPALYESRRIAPAGEYTFGIEGPAVNAAGVLYVVNFRKQGTIGMLAPGASVSELFVELPPGSVGNSIRFDRDGRMYVADYKNHNVFVFDRGQTEPRLYFHSDAFNQPNDLTVAPDRTLYVSDPDWKGKKGQVWRITPGPDGTGFGEVMLCDRKMGTTNGIDLSPDGKTLYVGESDSGEIWSYRIDGNRLAAPRLIKRFADFSLDGIRTDIDGQLLVARILKGTVAVLAPDGRLRREIVLQAKEPSNLAFGGADGRTVFVTQRQGGFIESFRVERPGREFCLQAADETCGVRPRRPGSVSPRD